MAEVRRCYNELRIKCCSVLKYYVLYIVLGGTCTLRWLGGENYRPS